MKSVFGIAVSLFVFAAASSAQFAPFDEKSAAEVAVNQSSAKETALKLLEKSRQLYAAKDVQGAQANYSAAKLMLYLSEACTEIDKALLAYILSDAQFCETLSETLSTDDDLPKVFEILDKLWKDSPENFKKFRNLATAIAVVFDTPPPASWPHHQVSEKVLPRKFPDALETFKTWQEDRSKGRLLFPCEKLSVEEAKFLVASVAPQKDKIWARRAVNANIMGIAKIYSSVPYDHGRLNSQKFDWTGDDYSLETIKTKGGICTDQSYFTSEVAKAKGVPAFILSGAGSDGFHAWVAYMVKSGKWNFSVGRYEGGNFVTGRTIDPQTWKTSTNHELQRMSEGFRRNPKYRLSEIHSRFAGMFASDGDSAAAKKAAAEAVKTDPRNFDGWLLLLETTAKSDGDAGTNAVCANAIKAFAKYPDNDAYFRNILVENSLKTGKSADAKKLTNAFITKYKTSRPDLCMEFARRELLIDIETDDVKKLKTSYKRLFSIFKNNAAMTLNGIVIPVLNKLIAEGKTDKVKDVVEQTKLFVKANKDKTLSSNFDSVFAQVDKILAEINKKKQ